jgi:hypothetical protein
LSLLTGTNGHGHWRGQFQFGHGRLDGRGSGAAHRIVLGNDGDAGLAQRRCNGEPS